MKTIQGQLFLFVEHMLPVELIDDHLPDGVGAAGAVQGVPVTLVRHTVVQSVRPDGCIT